MKLITLMKIYKQWLLTKYILRNSNTETCIINSKIPRMEKDSTNKTYKHQSCATEGKLLQLNLTNYSLNKENKEYPLRKKCRITA